MRETGTIINVQDGRLEIRIDQPRPAVCGKCRACEVLGKGGDLVLRTSLDRVQPEPGSDAAAALEAGRRVLVEVPQVSPWTGIVWLLGMPITMFVAGLLAGANWPAWSNLLRLDGQLAGAVLGVLAGVATFAMARLIEKRHAGRVTIHPLAEQEPV
jgi:positive regulator of sigma E activity